MFTKQNFTDPQGVTHAQAIFQVHSANLTKNSSEDFHYDIATGQSSSDQRGGNSVDYRVIYWVSQEAKDDGLASYALVNTDNMTEHFNSVLDSSYDGLDAEQAAEKHLQDTVLVD